MENIQLLLLLSHEKKGGGNKHTFVEVRVLDDYNNCKCSKAL